MYAEVLYPFGGSGETIKLVQPNQSVLEGVVNFRIEQRYHVTGGIGDVKRELLLKVRPKDVNLQDEIEIYTMEIVDRMILDLPNEAIFVDSYESNVNTTVFHDGWYTIQIIYLEDGEELESVSADFHFDNVKEPPPEPGTTTTQITTGTTSVEHSTAAQLMTEAAIVLLFAAIALLAIYALLRKRRSRIDTLDRSIAGPSVPV